MTLELAKSVEHFEEGKKLFQSYAEALEIDLSFQDFTTELASIESQYSHPTGALILIRGATRQAIGCVGVRKLDHTKCELKRMYVQLDFRGKGLGELLLCESLKIATDLGYQKIRLDTLPTMTSAIQLYLRHGFYEIEPYRFNPIKGTKYFEKNLVDPL